MCHILVNCLLLNAATICEHPLGQWELNCPLEHVPMVTCLATLQGHMEPVHNTGKGSWGQDEAFVVMREMCPAQCPAPGPFWAGSISRVSPIQFFSVGTFLPDFANNIVGGREKRGRPPGWAALPLAVVGRVQVLHLSAKLLPTNFRWRLLMASEATETPTVPPGLECEVDSEPCSW